MLTEIEKRDYGMQSRYGFYKFPKCLIADQRINGITNDAKILYMLFVDRLSLSQANGWIDRDGDVIIKM